jgi:sporulation protein YlmC with PRC-barrel domain
MSNRYSRRIMNGIIEPEGQTIVDSSGEKIGEVEEIYLDLRTGNWDWALVHVGQFGDCPHLVPLAGADAHDEAVRVRITKDEVEDAPGIRPRGGRLSAHEEEQLFAYYDISDGRRADDRE